MSSSPAETVPTVVVNPTDSDAPPPYSETNYDLLELPLVQNLSISESRSAPVSPRLLSPLLSAQPSRSGSAESLPLIDLEEHYSKRALDLLSPEFQRLPFNERQRDEQSLDTVSSSIVQTVSVPAALPSVPVRAVPPPPPTTLLPPRKPHRSEPSPPARTACMNSSLPHPSSFAPPPRPTNPRRKPPSSPRLQPARKAPPAPPALPSRTASVPALPARSQNIPPAIQRQPSLPTCSLPPPPSPHPSRTSSVSSAPTPLPDISTLSQASNVPLNYRNPNHYAIPQSPNYTTAPHLLPSPHPQPMSTSQPPSPLEQPYSPRYQPQATAAQYYAYAQAPSATQYQQTLMPPQTQMTSPYPAQAPAQVVFVQAPKKKKLSKWRIGVDLLDVAGSIADIIK